MSENRFERLISGDAAEQLRRLDSESVHTCVTSPPYFGLRDYEAEGQIGLEATPQEYLERLVLAFREVRRVLRKDGTLWIVIGDSYCRKNRVGLKNKDLMGLPWALAFALRRDGWYLRQDIVWHKPNAMPEGVRDRCTRSHEYIFLLSKSERYYFDNDTIREPFKTPARSGERRSYKPGCASSFDLTDGHLPQKGNFAGLPLNPLGRNKRDVWTVPSSSFQGAHFAVFPEKLVEPCVLAGSPRGGVVLDPFMGSGTTGAAAKRLARSFIGIDISTDYCAMAARRLLDVKGAA